MKYDVLIAGAGPAGSTAAKFLAEKGFKVLLTEKDKLPRDKPCGGGVTLRVFERFKYLTKLMGTPIYGGYVFSPSLKTRWEINSDTPLAVTVVRREFDHELVEMATKAGAEFIDANAVRQVAVNENEVKIRLSDGSEVRSDILIGADGVNSVVARETGLNPKWSDNRVALFIVKDIEVQKEVYEKQLAYFYLGFNGLIGYAWLFPKRKHVNIGLVGLLSETRNIKETYAKYTQLLMRDNIIPKNINIENYGAALIPVGGPLKKTYADRVLLCGDAAGFANPLTGEGIYYAMVSGELAANVAMEALNNGDATEKTLSTYQRKWMSMFGSDLKVALSLRKFCETKNGLETILKLGEVDEKLKEIIVYLFLGMVPSREARRKLYFRYPVAYVRYIAKKIFA